MNEYLILYHFSEILMKVLTICLGKNPNEKKKKKNFILDKKKYKLSCILYVLECVYLITIGL